MLLTISILSKFHQFINHSPFNRQQLAPTFYEKLNGIFNTEKMKIIIDVKKSLKMSRKCCQIFNFIELQGVRHSNDEISYFHAVCKSVLDKIKFECLIPKKLARL